MGRLIVWVSMAALVLMAVAAAWRAWRACRRAGARPADCARTAAAAGLLVALPGGCLALALAFAWRRVWRAGLGPLAVESLGALGAGEPSCAR